MPSTAELDEPLTLAQRAKQHFQQPDPPREVTHEPASTEAKERTAKEPPKEPDPSKAETKPSQNEPPKQEPPSKPDPQSEEEAVFGTPPAKSLKSDAPQADAEFETKLKEETTGMTEKAAKKWAELRRSEKEAREEARLVREEMKTSAEARQESKAGDNDPKLAALTEENAALKLQLEEAEKVLSVQKVESSKKYRREVGEPLGDLTKQVEEIAGQYDVSSKDILSALRAEKKERAGLLAELAADFAEPDRVELYSIANQIDLLNRKAEKLRDQAKTDLSALEQEERDAEERTSAEMRAAYGTSAKRAWEEAAAEFDFLRPNAAAPEWTAALANANASATTYVPGKDPIADGRIAAEAHIAPFLRKALSHKSKLVESLTAERDQLLDRIESDNAHDPGLSSARDEDVTGQDESDEELTIGQRAKAAAGKMGR